MQEDKLLKLSPPEIKVYDPSAFHNQVMHLYDRKLKANMIGYYLGVDTEIIEDIIEYNKNLRNASK